jgi:uncharacterized protein YjiS (DUF1127 family)
MLSPYRNTAPPPEHRHADPLLLREDHLVCFIIDAILAIPAGARRWLMRRRTRELLAALDERQLRDIGLVRADISSDGATSRAVLARRDRMAWVGGTISNIRRWWAGRDLNRQALAELDDDQLSDLSDLGRQVRREARREARRHVRQCADAVALRR